MTVKETVRTRQAVGLVRPFNARIFFAARTILIRPGVRANDSLFHSEVVSFVKKIVVDRQNNRNRGLEPGLRNFELPPYFYLVIYIVEWWDNW